MVPKILRSSRFVRAPLNTRGGHPSDASNEPFGVGHDEEREESRSVECGRCRRFSGDFIERMLHACDVLYVSAILYSTRNATNTARYSFFLLVVLIFADGKSLLSVALCIGKQNESYIC